MSANIQTLNLSGASTLLNPEIQYDTEARTLRVCFRKTKAWYAYAGVPPEVVAALVLDPEPGKYFTVHIKGTYTYTRES
jgi:hypothetical protein